MAALPFHRCRQFVEMVNGTDSEVRSLSSSPKSQDSYPGSPSLSPDTSSHLVPTRTIQVSRSPEGLGRTGVEKQAIQTPFPGWAQGLLPDVEGMGNGTIAVTPLAPTGQQAGPPLLTVPRLCGADSPSCSNGHALHQEQTEPQ